MDRNTLVRWVVIAAAIFLFMKFGLPMIRGGDKPQAVPTEAYVNAPGFAPDLLDAPTDGKPVDAYWLTNYTKASLRSEALFRLAKSRWEIENQGFNDAKNRYGMEHICHHDANALVVGWLLLQLSLVIERLYRLCFLHRGARPRASAADLVTLLWLALRPPRPHDSS